MKKLLCFMTFLLLSIAAACTSITQDTTASEQVLETNKQFLLTYPNLENPGGEILLENEHVVLQRLVVGPGKWGRHSLSSRQPNLRAHQGWGVVWPNRWKIRVFGRC